jgi:HSP20 family protein
MSIVKFSNRPFEHSFNSFVDDFFAHSPSLIRNSAHGQPTGFKALANIRKKEAGYELEVIAPGFEKEAFKIDLEQNLLTISAEIKAEKTNQNEKQIRSEFRIQSFKRSFSLDDSIDQERIEARYNNGILVVSLPKKTEVKEPVKQITIQ